MDNVGQSILSVIQISLRLLKQHCFSPPPYYEFCFPFTLIFKYNFAKILLLMTFISISISLKTSNILGNKSQVFERSDCSISVHNDFYYNELKI